MKFNIIVPYRALSNGCISSPDGELHQNPNGEWNDGTGTRLDNKAYVVGYNSDTRGIGPFRSIIDRCICMLNENSMYKHKIIVATDYDMYPNDNFLKEYDNVVVHKAPPVPDNKKNPWRFNWALLSAAKSIPPEEWVCFCYSADLICSKNWDEPIVNAINKMGEGYVYSPMLVEICISRGEQNPLMGVEPTPEQIWVDWRERFGLRYLLTMPLPSKKYVTPEHLKHFTEIAGRGHHLLPQKRSVIIEPCGTRDYGYILGYITKSKYMNRNIVFSGPGYDDEKGKHVHAFDMATDDNFRDVTGHMKAVIADSFLFHPYCEFKMDDK